MNESERYYAHKETFFRLFFFDMFKRISTYFYSRPSCNILKHRAAVSDQKAIDTSISNRIVKRHLTSKVTFKIRNTVIYANFPDTKRLTVSECL